MLKIADVDLCFNHLLLVLAPYNLVNYFSFMSECFPNFLGWTSTKCLGSGFPQALEIMVNLEITKKKFHAWKNHRILGKNWIIMEKLWKFVK